MHRLLALGAFLLALIPAMVFAGRLPSAAPGPQLSVSPRVVHPHATVSIHGNRFPASRTLTVQMFCPVFGNKSHGYAQWAVRTNRHGAFSQTRKAPTPLHASSTACNLYVLVFEGAKGFYVSTGFKIR